MEALSNIDVLSAGSIDSQQVVALEGSRFFLSDSFQNVKSNIQNVASAAFQRLSLAWSNIREGVTKLLQHGAEKFQGAENKLLASAQLFLTIPGAMLYSAPAGVMGLFGMDIKPYLENN